MDADRAAAALASRQDGVITLDDALACGLTLDQVQWRVETGRWERLVRGVYRVAGAPDTWRQRTRAAYLAVAEAGGVVSHVSAAALHELRTPPVLPQVTVPRGRSVRCPIAKVRLADLRMEDLATVDGLRCTSASRVLVELASVLCRAELEAVVDDAICGGRASISSAVRAIDRAGPRRRGVPLLRSVLHVWSGAIKPGSQAEARLLRRLDEWGLPPPVLQYEVMDDSGCFVARVDAAWPARRVALEYEGVRHHAARAAAPDEGRYERLEALGWRVVTADKHDLLPGQRHLADRIRRANGHLGPVGATPAGSRDG